MCAYHQSVQKSKGVFIFVLLPLLFFLTAATHKPDSDFTRIRNSIPQREAGWKIIEADEDYNEGDGSIQFNFLWANNSEDVSATVIVHKSLKAAKEQFKHPPEDESAMEGFLIDGIGDRAYLFPPVILNQDGPFNLWFRKGQYEISMCANSKDTVKRCAKHIIDSISQPNKDVKPDAAKPRR